MNIDRSQKLYFVGIAGTGMASVAGLCQAAGFQVIGSDQNLYPPMSDLLDELKIPVFTPYHEDNIKNHPADVYVIANSLSRGHKELEAALATQKTITSFPALLGKLFLKDSISVVVSGTHGKTTTTSLLAHLLKELGANPSFMIGGVARNFAQSFYFSGDKEGIFVIEGDEYDTAYFDKNSKFLHYCPDYVIFNNLEFDHADIFKDLEAIENQFIHFLNLVPNKKNIVVYQEDLGAKNLITKLEFNNQVSTTSKFDSKNKAKTNIQIKHIHESGQWSFEIESQIFGTLSLSVMLQGEHNAANCVQVVGLLERLFQDGNLKKYKDPYILKKDIEKGFSTFKGIARRLEKIGEYKGAWIYEDFAHHPTAIAHVIESYRRTQPTRRVVVAFEPRSATARRSVLLEGFARALSLADEVYLGACFQDLRIPEKERMDTQALAKKIGSHARAYPSNEDLYESMLDSLRPTDAVIFMSSGSFSGIHHRLVEKE